MTHDWFYMPAIPAAGAVAALDQGEARHALGARRLTEGAAVSLFDGNGTIASAKLVNVSKRGASVEIVERSSARSPTAAITLASALPKGERQSTMLSMAGQLGIARFVPLICARSVAEPGKGFAARTQRIFIEACKQSRQAFLPTIAEPQEPAALARSAAAAGELVIVADPTGAALADARLHAPATLVIGPEGGFTDAELSDMRSSGASIVTLGHSTLRTETAAVALLAWTRLTLRE